MFPVVLFLFASIELIIFMLSYQWRSVFKILLVLCLFSHPSFPGLHLLLDFSSHSLPHGFCFFAYPIIFCQMLDIMNVTLQMSEFDVLL